MNPVQIETPDFSHLNNDDFEHIYSPSEDTFLLIDAFEKDMENILKLKPSICLEMGIGSGVVLTALASVVGDLCSYYGADINPIACEKAKETGAKNGVLIETFCSDLTSNIPQNIKGKIDILIFNPPYVETLPDEVAAGELELTWAGGNKGRQVMDKLFPHIPTLLSSTGVFYLVLENKNKPEEVNQIFLNMGYSSQCIIFRRTLQENLSIFKYTRQ